MADVKVTKAQMFAEVVEMAKAQGRQDIVDFANHEIELLSKRKSADSKAKAKKAAENEALANQIIEVLAAADTPMAALEIATNVGISTQKATPILVALAKEGRVEKTTEKRKNFYSLAE